MEMEGRRWPPLVVPKSLVLRQRLADLVVELTPKILTTALFSRSLEQARRAAQCSPARKRWENVTQRWQAPAGRHKFHALSRNFLDGERRFRKYADESFFEFSGPDLISSNFGNGCIDPLSCEEGSNLRTEPINRFFFPD